MNDVGVSPSLEAASADGVFDAAGRRLPPPLPPAALSPLFPNAALIQALAAGTVQPPPPPVPPPARKPPGLMSTAAPSRPPPPPRPPKPAQFSIFVGNIGFDTTEDEVTAVFRGLTGLRQFRLAANPGIGGSRGFGFVEFEDANSALEAIKSADGKEVRGRKLRLRWGEQSPTTPEVDEFHRTPERLKTRHCYEIFQGSTCPRGSGCPYAHSQSEIRKRAEQDPLGDQGGSRSSASTTTASETAPVADGSFKVPVPFERFSGSTDEEKQRTAFNTVLGVGAKHMRFMMRRTSCRLQLRGAGDRATSIASGSKEPLHVVVKPGVGNDSVSEEQLDAVRKMVEEIVKNGKPAGLEEGASGATIEAAKSEQAETCAMGLACPNLDCRCSHPRLPGQHPPPDSKAIIQFFILRSEKLSSIQISVRMGIWATSRLNTDVLQVAWARCSHVVLIFIDSQTNHFQGYARMASAPSTAICPGAWSETPIGLGENFKVDWLKQCLMPFSVVDSLRNGLAQDAPLRKSRDGQEVAAKVAEILVRMMYQQHDVKLLELPVDVQETDTPRARSRSRKGSRSRSRKKSRSRSGQHSPRRRSRSRSVRLDATKLQNANSTEPVDTVASVDGLSAEKDSQGNAPAEKSSDSPKDTATKERVEIAEAKDPTPAWMKKPDEASPAWTMAPASGLWTVGGSSPSQVKPPGPPGPPPPPPTHGESREGPPGAWAAVPPQPWGMMPQYGYPMPGHYGLPPYGSLHPLAGPPSQHSRGSRR